MKFEELMEGDRKRKKQSYDPYTRYNDDYPSSNYEHKDKDFQQLILNKLKDNPKLKSILIPVVISLVIGIIVIIVVFFPQIVKLVEFLYDKVGSGLIDSAIKGSK